MRYDGPFPGVAKLTLDRYPHIVASIGVGYLDTMPENPLRGKGRGNVDRRMPLLNQHGGLVQNGYMGCWSNVALKSRQQRGSRYRILGDDAEI